MSAWAVNKPIFLNPNYLYEIYMNDAMSTLGQKQTHALQQQHRYSITSSARPTSVLGTVMPSALALLRFMISSTLVAC
jgi:hypothetical protein